MFNKKLKRKGIIATIILAAALAFGGCSTKESAGQRNLSVKTAGAAATYVGETPNYETNAYNDVYEYEPSAAEYGETTADYAEDGLNDNPGREGNLVEPGAAQSRKLIRTVNLDVETKEYEQLKSEIERKIAELGGYVENEYSYNGSSYNGSNVRYSEMVIRIPDKSLDEFVGTMGGLANIVSKRTSAQDVTLQYTDIESKRDMYRAEQESLTALLERAETVEDITYLTQRLTEVRYNIESMERQLRVYDNQVDYATVYLNVQEVEVLTPQVVEKKTTAEEMKEGFENSMQSIGNGFKNFGKNFVINLPYMLLLLAIVGVHAIAIAIIVAVSKKKIRKARALNAARKEALKEENKTMEAKTKDEVIKDAGEDERKTGSEESEAKITDKN